MASRALQETCQHLLMPCRTPKLELLVDGDQHIRGLKLVISKAIKQALLRSRVQTELRDKPGGPELLMQIVLDSFHNFYSNSSCRLEHYRATADEMLILIKMTRMQYSRSFYIWEKVDAVMDTISKRERWVAFDGNPLVDYDSLGVQASATLVKHTESRRG